MSNLSNHKVTYCPGPGAVLSEWFTYQREYFGRGDHEYQILKEKTLNWLKKKAGQDIVVPIAGSGTTAAIVAINSFLQGKILIINTGYYSQRWSDYLKNTNLKNNFDFIDYEKFIDNNFKKKTYDWVLFVYVETASCKKFNLKKVDKIRKKLGSKLIMDATASIGLENNHNLADVVFFSSCKGLLGPTGLGFIAYKNKTKVIKSKDFWFDLETHSNAKYTLGYNCMASLYGVSMKHNIYKKKILMAAKIMKKFTLQEHPLPKIGIPLKYDLIKKINKNIILYQPRKKPNYDVIFFLGITKFSFTDIKKILKNNIINNLNY